MALASCFPTLLKRPTCRPFYASVLCVQSTAAALTLQNVSICLFVFICSPLVSNLSLLQVFLTNTFPTFFSSFSSLHQILAFTFFYLFLRPTPSNTILALFSVTLSIHPKFLEIYGPFFLFKGGSCCWMPTVLEECSGTTTPSHESSSPLFSPHNFRQTPGLLLQMLTTVCSKHEAVWPDELNDWDKDVSGMKKYK